MSSLAAALGRFTAAYHARPDLVAGQADWSRTLRLVAADTGATLTVRVEAGRIAAVHAGDAVADLTVTADEATLCDVLELRRGPNEPYLYGELTVRGPEADFVRLDYITECLCPP
jgi:hypothetical protein